MQWLQSLIAAFSRRRPGPELSRPPIKPIAEDILDRDPLSYADPPDLVPHAKVEAAIAGSKRRSPGTSIR